METKEQNIKPVLRWAGGKSWIFERIQGYFPENILNYYEPFIGGASIFLNLNIEKKKYISDINSELICFYRQVKTNSTNLISKIKQFQNTREEFYRVRSSKPRSEAGIAARFYYLNRTCFNGLFRVNQKGQFNVPYGYRDIEIFDSVRFELLKRRLQKTHIQCCDFEDSLSRVKKGDFVFLDPPYTVAHNKNGFIEYNQNIFSWEDQERLQKCVKELIKKGTLFLMTNACHDSLKKLYKGVGKQFEVDRFSTISGQMNSRYKISELIITNCI